MEHFKKTGNILGKHPIFKKLIILDNIRKLTVGELVKKRHTLIKCINDNKRNLKKYPDHTKSHERKDKVELLQSELTEVNRLLSLK